MMNLILFLIVNVVFCYMATVGFGVILNIPRRGLNACGIVGVIGWLVYVCIKDCFSSSMLANLLAAFSIGMGAMFCARFKKMPMILFNIPSLVPLVPGGQAYRAVRYFAIGKNDLALSNLVQVGMIAGSIAVGFFLSEFVSQVYFKIHGYSQQ